MCGRYAFEASKKELLERYRLEETTFAIEEKAEIFPTNVSPIVLPDSKLAYLTWGFMPSFAKRPLINARAETILQKPTFKKAFQKKRCLVPATSFFEWKKEGGAKEKYRISVKEQTIFSIAGICEFFTDKDGQEKLMYSIITTDANAQMQDIHDRMPVILCPEHETDYLNHELDPAKVQQWLQPTKQELWIVKE